MSINLLGFILFLAPLAAFCELNVVTTTTTAEAIVKEISGNKIKIVSIAKGPQDPHYLEAKPSYMVVMASADLLVTNGLELESGWLPLILRGARNSKLQTLELCSLIEAIEIPHKVDRSEGDVHPNGNPHCLLDPKRVSLIASHIANKLSSLDSNNRDFYQNNLKTFSEKLKAKIVDWKTRLASSTEFSFITYHKTINYFLAGFGLNHAGFIEPKPGIPPTAKHIMMLIENIKTQRVNCVLVESFFETDSAVRLNKATGIPYRRVAAEVGATAGTDDYFTWMEALVNAIKDCRVNH